MPRSEKLWRALSSLLNIVEKIRLWLPIREESIRFLREIADALDHIKKDVNVAKLTGASAGIAGVVLLGAGALASIVTMGAAAPFVIGAGVAATVGGGLVSGGAEIVWLVENKTHQKKVKKGLKEDYAKQEELLREVQTLQDLITQIRQEENISEEEALRDLLEIVINRDNNGAGAERAKVRRRRLLRYRNVIEIFLQSPIPSFIPVSGALGLTRAVASWSSLAARTAARGGIVVLTPICFAIDTYQLVTTAKDVHHGSQSEAGRKLRETANELEAELNTHRNFLDNLQTMREDILPGETH